LTRPRPREAGIWFGELPTGRQNAITDVPGVKVGHCTIISGSGALVPGKGPVRTGVTVVLPHGGDMYHRPVKGAHYDFNGCGGLSGALQISEFGVIDTPIGLTNTMSMGTVGEAIIKHMLKANTDAGAGGDAIIPTVSECDDSYLNDARGMHVREEHVFAALANASDRVEEGAVGAGTGMTAYGLKGGIGTSSRIVSVASGRYVLGVLVLTNHGDMEELRIDGVPVGAHVEVPEAEREEQGSIVMVVGTNAPLDSRQLGRIAKRAIMGLATTGSCSQNGSGDIVVSFSTANIQERYKSDGLVAESFLRDRDLDPFFRATVDAVSEAIISSLFKAETVMGRDDNVSYALPLDQTLAIMKAHNRLRETI